MEELPERSWTADQSKVLDDAEAILDRAFNEAAAVLASGGLGDDIEPSSCLRCSCEFFVPRGPDIIPGAEAPRLACMRIGCRHLYTSHRIF